LLTGGDLIQSVSTACGNGEPDQYCNVTVIIILLPLKYPQKDRKREADSLKSYIHFEV